MTSLKKVSKSDLGRRFEVIQKACEDSEMLLSSSQVNFMSRKDTGSYYTPIDACDFFWDQFFSLRGIGSKEKAERFIRETEFVEPAVGAGMFVFSLLKKLLFLGCSFSSFTEIQITSHDINSRALSFVKGQLQALESETGLSFGDWRFKKGDFLKNAKPFHTDRNLVFVGNPPFVKNGPGAKWKNSFADFFEKSYLTQKRNADVAFILPLSFTFSRDYILLRKLVLSDKNSLYIANFDNIPDCIFKSGKPDSLNTNKANSQRCSIIFAFKNQKNRVYSTGLIRWSASERQQVFSNSPVFYDCLSITDEKQIPRPASSNIHEYFVHNGHKYNFSDLLNGEGEKYLHVASVARNYISFRDGPSSANHKLSFKTEEDYFTGLTLLSSDIFFDYWLSYGDGFHLTKSDISNFPITEELMKWAQKERSKAVKIWSGRKKYKKEKLNAGILSTSYDFSDVFTVWG